MTAVKTLMLDGIWGRTARFTALQRALEARCGPADMVRYESSGRSSLESLGRELASQIRRHGETVNLIGFSMGGLVVRAAHLVDPGLPIRRAAFLNSPHGGSWLSYLLPFEGIRDMRPGSEFLKRLDAAPWSVPSLVTWCPCDLMVLPGKRARWERATQTVCCRVPMHIWPVHSRSIHRRIVDFFAAP